MLIVIACSTTLDNTSLLTYYDKPYPGRNDLLGAARWLKLSQSLFFDIECVDSEDPRHGSSRYHGDPRGAKADFLENAGHRYRVGHLHG